MNLHIALNEKIKAPIVSHLKYNLDVTLYFIRLTQNLAATLLTILKVAGEPKKIQEHSLIRSFTISSIIYHHGVLYRIRDVLTPFQAETYKVTYFLVENPCIIHRQVFGFNRAQEVFNK